MLLVASGSIDAIGSLREASVRLVVGATADQHCAAGNQQTVQWWNTPTMQRFHRQPKIASVLSCETHQSKKR
jgi:hypothetical protein